MPMTAILSMLHEPPGGSASREFRGEPVLTWTLRRLSGASGIDRAAIVCWDDQAAAATTAAAESGAEVCSQGPRQILPALEMISAARRWADGWRGGLLGTCEFDRGFHAASIAPIAARHDAAAVLLVDPSAGLVDPTLIDAILEQGRRNPEVDLHFSQAAPGLSAVRVRTDFIARLVTAGRHPGALLSYQPDSPHHDPISDPACVPVAVPLARTTRRFTLDSARQIAAMENATAHLNGQLITTDAAGLLAALEAADAVDELPREIVVELNTERATDAIFRPTQRLGVARPPMELATAQRLFAALAGADDLRLVFAGAGDPLLHDRLGDFIAAAKSAGIAAISVETDFFGASPERVSALAASGVDIVSVHLPAAGAETYRQVMGVDGLDSVIALIKQFVQHRAAARRGLPLLVPTLVKCRQNLPEMESWYDQWLRALGCAVITGPSDFGGLIPNVAIADMTSPNRKPCVSLSRRLMVLSDGTIVSCEQDILGRQPLGQDVREAWKRAREMRSRSWEQYPVCSKCKQWNRA
jgi:hypothetical protein